MRLSLRGALALAALALGGCHAPELAFSGPQREIASRHLRVTTDLPAKDADALRGWLERTLETMCRRWGVPLPVSAPLSCYLFASADDFTRFRQYDTLLRGGHARQAGTCLGFYCAGCDAFATSPAVARGRPSLDDPSTWRPVEHVLAHELNHHLLDRHGARGTPAWLSEGVAEIEGLRAWSDVAGAGPTAPAQVYRTLCLVALAIRGLYDEPIFDRHDPDLSTVTWGQEYHLDLPLCLALQDLDRNLLQRLATGGSLPARWTPAALERAVRERGLVLASEALLALGRADPRLRPSAHALLGMLWDEPAWDGSATLPADAVDAYWGGRLSLARTQLRARQPLGVRLGLRARDVDRTAGLARARQAVWLLAEGVAWVAPGDRSQASLADLELWLLGDAERRALLARHTAP